MSLSIFIGFIGLIFAFTCHWLLSSYKNNKWDSPLAIIFSIIIGILFIGLIVIQYQNFKHVVLECYSLGGCYSKDKYYSNLSQEIILEYELELAKQKVIKNLNTKDKE
jgi:FtsH-binding integral membrane protein